MVTAEGLEECSIAVIVTASQDEALALDILLHDFKELAHLVIGLLLAVADVGKGEKWLGAAEAAGKLGQGGMVGDREGARGVEGAGQTLNAKDDVHENAVDV